MIRSRSCAFQAATQCSANRCASSLVSIASLRVDMSAVSDSCGPSVPGATADDEQLRDEPFRTHVEIAERPENRPLPPQEDAIILVARPYSSSTGRRSRRPPRRNACTARVPSWGPELWSPRRNPGRSEEHTSELQSLA